MNAPKAPMTAAQRKAATRERERADGLFPLSKAYPKKYHDEIKRVIANFLAAKEAGQDCVARASFDPETLAALSSGLSADGAKILERVAVLIDGAQAEVLTAFERRVTLSEDHKRRLSIARSQTPPPS